MSWTYTDGDPSASNLNAVRFTIGDTDTTDQQLTDEEITYILGTNAQHIADSAAQAAEALAAKYSRMVDQTVGDVKMAFSQRAKYYLTLAAQIRRTGRAATMPAPVFTALTKDAKAANKADTTINQPAFHTGMHDNEDAKPEVTVRRVAEYGSGDYGG